MTAVDVELTLARRPYPVPVLSVLGGHVILYGYSLKESTGAATAELDLYDGTSTASLLAVPITLGAGMSTEEWFGPQGVHFRNGLMPSLASGAVVGSLFIADHNPGA